MRVSAISCLWCALPLPLPLLLLLLLPPPGSSSSGLPGADEAMTVNGARFSMGTALRYLSKAIYTDALAGGEEEASCLVQSRGFPTFFFFLQIGPERCQYWLGSFTLLVPVKIKLILHVRHETAWPAATGRRVILAVGWEPLSCSLFIALYV